jgi:hypothetical protein
VLLQNGAVALTCELEDSFKLFFFNLAGEEPAALPMNGKLVRLVPITTRLAETFLVVTKASKNVMIVSGSNFTVWKVLGQTPSPELVAALGNSRRLLMVEGTKTEPGGENRLAVLPF